MQEQIEAILKFHMPRWNELPNISLYLDQVVTLINAGWYYHLDNKFVSILEGLWI